MCARDGKKGGGTSREPDAGHHPANAELEGRDITEALEAADADKKADYERNSRAYLKKIYAMLAEAKAKLGALPPGDRKIVTSHDAFGYLGQACG
ncbi:metal ABC transporter substrate-binding protein, partial [Pseudomonas ogarae]